MHVSGHEQNLLSLYNFVTTNAAVSSNFLTATFSHLTTVPSGILFILICKQLFIYVGKYS